MIDEEEKTRRRGEKEKRRGEERGEEKRGKERGKNMRIDRRDGGSGLISKRRSEETGGQIGERIIYCTEEDENKEWE